MAASIVDTDKGVTVLAYGQSRDDLTVLADRDHLDDRFAHFTPV